MPAPRRYGAIEGRTASVIYLHIGRNKAGSTTLQDFFLKNIAELERHGIHYALYGHLKDSVPGVPGFDRQDAIASYARTYPERSLLISHEWMLQWDAIHAEIMAAALRGLPVKIIVHMRPYPSWICSNYAQDVRIGESSEHFDDYFESFRPKLSMWPDLRRWGELFGWDNVIVRLIDARNTPWRSLTGDFLEILGLDAGLGSAVPPSNQSPSWAITEFLRAMSQLKAGPATTEALQKLLQKFLDANPLIGRDVQYLTPAQGRQVAEIYAEDIARINDFANARLDPEPLAALPDRPFLPAFRQLPPVILRDFADRAGARDFMSVHPEATAALQGLGLLRRPFGEGMRGMAAAVRRRYGFTTGI
jgi:hypothetical protein